MPKENMGPPKTKYITAKEVVDRDGAYARLAVAIVEQAAKDANGWGYFNRTKEDWLTEKNHEFNKNWQINSVRHFFCDDDSIFALCMPNTDGPTMYKMIMHNYEVYGNYMPPGQTAFGGAVVL